MTMNAVPQGGWKEVGIIAERSNSTLNFTESATFLCLVSSSVNMLFEVFLVTA